MADVKEDNRGNFPARRRDDVVLFYPYFTKDKMTKFIDSQDVVCYIVHMLIISYKRHVAAM